MYVTDVSRQQFSKFASRGLAGRTTLTGQGLVLGAETLLAKLDGKALPVEAEQERIWTLLSVAYGEEVPHAVLGSGTVSNRGRLTRTLNLSAFHAIIRARQPSA